MSITTSRLPHADQKRQFFFDNLADGYYEADIQGNLLAANTSLARLLGCEHSAELIGRGYTRFIDESQMVVLVQAAQRIKRTGDAAPLITCPVTRANGEQRLFEVSVALVRNEAGKPVNFQGIVRDITESTRDAASARQLDTQQAELEALRKRYDE